MRYTYALVSTLLVVSVTACGPGSRNGNGGDDDDGQGTCPVCTEDKTAVVDCNGNATQCPPDQLCSNGMCMSGCEAAEKNHSSVGCDYFAVDMDAAAGPPKDACYAVFVANTSRAPVHITTEWNGMPIDLSKFGKLPVGTGKNLSYAPYDVNAGIMPGQVAILFLSYELNLLGGINVACPVPAAMGKAAQVDGTGKGHAFHITTDLPVVAYQMLPYGGGAAAATGASLLLPSSSWGDNYVAVAAYDSTMPPPIDLPVDTPSHNFVAKEDGTLVTIKPFSALAGGGGLPAGAAGQPYQIMLNKGEYAQISQSKQVTGSPVTSNKPIGEFGGHQILAIDRCCGDHAEQMITPVRAAGSEYVAAPHGDRKPTPGEPRLYRIIGDVNQTALTYEPPNVGPATVNQGQILEIRTADPFVVRSQDTDHPFHFFTYMTGSGDMGEGGWGDADFVRLVPPLQYLYHYVFFTDPTYPFTMLTMVRKKHMNQFEEVSLECMGNVTGWQPVGTSGDYEITWVKIVDHFNGVGGCNNGVHTIDSKGQVGVWVWGWGSEDTNTGWVSYGYPAGEGVLPINDVVIE